MIFWVWLHQAVCTVSWPLVSKYCLSPAFSVNIWDFYLVYCLIAEYSHQITWFEESFMSIAQMLRKDMTNVAE